MKRAEKIAKLEEIFCRWNDRDNPDHLNGDHAMHEISKLFNVETLRAWRTYVDAREIVRLQQKQKAKA